MAMVALLLGALATTTVASLGGANRDDTAGSRRDRRHDPKDDRTRNDDTGGPGGMTIDQSQVSRSQGQSTLTAAGPAPPSHTYSFTGGSAEGDSAIFASLSALSVTGGWTINVPPANDTVVVGRTYVSGPSTNLLARDVTTLAWSGNSLTVNTSTFTFSSADDASAVGMAIALARGLSTATTVTLANVSSTPRSLSVVIARTHD